MIGPVVLKLVVSFSRQLIVETVRKVEGDGVLDKGLEVVNGRIQLTDPELLARKPILLFKLFSQAARIGLPGHQHVVQPAITGIGP